MKKAFTYLLLASSFHAATAQLVIDADNNPHSAAYDDIREITEFNIPLPQAGIDLVYDYSNLISTDQDLIPYIPATRDGFTDSDRFSYGSTNLGPVPLYSEYYTKKTAEGLQRTGSYKLPEDLSLELFTGSNLDSLIFPGNINLFDVPVYQIKYPATIGSSWGSTYKFITQFELSVAAFGLDHVPGIQNQTVELNMEVVGSGTLILPTTDGPSDPFDVLVFKESRLLTDSTFLGGAPAPAPLLATFGLTQGGQTDINRYYFYTENQERPLMVINMSEDWETAERCFFASEGVTNSIASLDGNDFAKPYPNPVRQNESVVFSLPNNQNDCIFSVYDQVGKLVETQSGRTVSGNQLIWNINSNIPVGMYIYHIQSANGTSLQKGKILVH